MASSSAPMSFLDHLRELRRRMWISALFFLVTTLVAIAFADDLLAFIVSPLYRAFSSVPGVKPEDIKLHFANPVDPVFVELKLSLYAGLFCAAPMLMFQLWRFVAPGLYPNEKRHAWPLLIGTFFFFIGGGLFGYGVVFPIAFEFLLRFGMSINASMPLDPTIMVTDYVDLAVGLLFAFGLVFELPLVIVFLARIGLVDHRKLLRFFRYFVVIAFVVGAVLTPTPDPLNQTLMAAPLIVLYLLATGAAYFIQKKRERRKDEEDDADQPPRKEPPAG